MSGRPPRWIPLLAAVIELSLAAAIIIFWRPQAGTVWWYVRAVPFVLLAYQGCVSLWHVFISSDATLRRRLHGDFKDSN